MTISTGPATYKPFSKKVNPAFLRALPRKKNGKAGMSIGMRAKYGIPIARQKNVRKP